MRATIRMKKGVEAWQEKRRIHDLLVDKAKQQRIQQVVRKEGGDKGVSADVKRVDELRVELGDITY